MKIGDINSAEVKEFSKDFAFDKNSATQRLPAANAAALTDTEGYHRNYDPELYNLVDATGGKKRQKCAAVAEISPETADEIKGTKFIVSKFGAAMYDDASQQSTAKGIETKKTYEYTIPQPEGDFKAVMKPKETGVKDRQLLSSQEQSVAASTVKTGASGQVKQKVETGFEINPLDQSANDELVFNFDLDAPQTVLPKGTRVMQWVTFSNPNNKKEKPQTIGCSTLVGDPYASHVQTWKGATSMKDDSKAVKGKAYNKQNSSEKAKKKESFKLVQEAEWYEAADHKSDDGATDMRLAPCVAKLDMGKKM